MAKDGLFARPGACFLLLVGSLCLPALLHGDNPPSISTTLAVQTALQQGREHLVRNNARAAVYALEGQLANINGSREYLAVLRDAYRAYIKELRHAGQDDLAQQYMQRLLIIDPGAALDQPAGRTAVTAAPKAAVSETKLLSKDPAPAPTAPAKRDEETALPDNLKHKEALDLVGRAEQEFVRKQYAAAGQMFEQAWHLDRASTSNNVEHWAYCKLYRVAQELNQAKSGEQPAAELESEVRVAMNLSPKLPSKLDEFAKTLLNEIRERRTAVPETPPVLVQHYNRTPEGWYLAETANFRIFHNQTRELAEKAAQVAERTRTEMTKKWFGERGGDWNPKCEIYLHATGQDYSRVTRTPMNSPGHSTISNDNSRIVGRRIDLHVDNPDMLYAVLPHEATHVVLAGRFGGQDVPRWADEGVAVLTEPREKIERHLRNLPQYAQNNQLFSVQQLMQLRDYPDPRYIGSFYAQSVSLCEFLAKEKGPLTFTQFLRDSLRGDYESALRHHYGFRDFGEAEQRWRQYALQGAATAAR
jgi:hypothetical protein